MPKVSSEVLRSCKEERERGRDDRVLRRSGVIAVKELIPVLLGVGLALLVERLPTSRARVIGWLLGSVVAGVAVTVLTGEWAIAPELVLVDVPLVAGAAALTRVVLLRRARVDASPMFEPYRRGHPAGEPHG